MKLSSNAHQFAFFTELVSHIAQYGAHLDIHQITDPELVHRITTVVRLGIGDSFILFDTNYHATVTILGIQPKKAITLELHSLEPNCVLQPRVTWLLPLLKREAFEEALYTLTELGATAIQPIVTRKTGKAWSEKDTHRSRKIMIAAAEQSKQFIVPVLLPILPLETWLMQPYPESMTKLFFDPQGVLLGTVLSSLQERKPDELVACAGPEGDLSQEEKDLLARQNFIFCRLTPTILRAQQAIAIGLGTLRSLL
jgi:16S rRNA (uracil1498-N3)-methyltransferase